VIGPRPLDAVATVVTGDDVTSPFTGARAAFFHVALLELGGAGAEHALGEMVLGDVVVLRVAEAGVDVALVVRRATVRLVSVRTGATPLDALARLPPEAVPLLARSRGQGTPCFREHAVRQGARVRLRATVEGSGSRAFVRDDLAPVFVDELLGGG
jgi:hypothetical protein